MGKSAEIDAYLKGIVLNLPDSPGCYQYLDESGTVIYVGKAKNLKRRVSSYFNKEQQTRKTRLLVTHIRDIRYIIVRSEEDALLLENNLIKRYKPRYNVLLKDDKSYPSIAVSSEYLPRVFRTRNRSIRGATYFGPYSHQPTINALIDLCVHLYNPRPCHTQMTKEGVEGGKYTPCLDFHIHRCKGPCCGKQSHEEYLAAIEGCKEILRGNTTEVSRRLRDDMTALAEEMRFEEAQALKERYLLIEKFRQKSEVVSSFRHHVDVFSIESEENVAFINYLHVFDGCINQAFTFEYKKKLDETDVELLTMGIIEMRERYGSTAHEIVVPFLTDIPAEIAEQTIPQKGDKKKLLDLSRLNVKQYRFDRLKQAEKLNPEQKQTRLMKEFQKELSLPSLPLRIELFDNSNISGTDAVAACVVFDRLKPAKKEYRKYLIKTVTGPDDYASMKEVVRRRYTRLRDESLPFPNLIIADGGVGQMEVIRSVTEDELSLNIPIAGLAKDDRHRTRELLYGFPPVHVGLKIGGQLFRTLEMMQEEVHRFAVSFHRDLRSRRQTASELDNVAGVGPVTKEKLLKQFKSVKRIKEASKDELQTLLGNGKGANIYRSLHPELD